METKHTKGKWEPIFERYPEEPVKVYTGVGINTKRDGGTYTEFICNSMLPDDDEEYIKQHAEIEANMKLIAAAPEMFRVLFSILIVEKRKYQNRVESANRHNNTDGVGISFDYVTPEPMPQWVVEIEEILKKATE